MKAIDLAKKLLENPDFEVEFGITEPDGSVYGVGHRRFSVKVDDIGHSDRLIVLGPGGEVK